MARLARLVVPGMPHHITQRGNRRQQTFASFVMDEPYLLAAARYVELNPVRAGLAPNPADWPWSSVGAHLDGRDDSLVTAAPLLALVGDWRAFLESALSEEDLQKLRRHSRTGRPSGTGPSWGVWRRWLAAFSAPRNAARNRSIARNKCVWSPEFPFDCHKKSECWATYVSLNCAIAEAKAFLKENKNAECMKAAAKYIENAVAATGRYDCDTDQQIHEVPDDTDELVKKLTAAAAGLQ